MSPRVVLVVGRFPSRSQTFIANKFAGLVDAGIDAYVLCREPDDALDWSMFPSLANRDDLRPRVLRSKTEQQPGEILRTARSFARAAVRPWRFTRYVSRRAREKRPSKPLRALRDAWLLRLRPDVVHFEFGNEAAARRAVLPLLESQITVSLRGADVNFNGLHQTGPYDDVWPHVSAVHTLGDDLWRRARGRGWPASMPVVIIPPAIDAHFFSRETRIDDGVVGTAERPLRILSVARLHWKKALPNAVEAVHILRDRGVSVDYRIVGDGPSRNEVQDTASDLGCKDAVTLVGSLSPEGVKTELERTDILVHPAVSEGFANVVVEAQSMAVPVVCSDADGLPENVVHGVTGLVVSRRNPTAIANAVADLASNSARRRAMGRAGRARVLEKFRIEDQISAFVEFYMNVASGRLPQPRPLRSPSGEAVGQI